jgi:anti-sigma B factor antagonist
MISGCLPVVSPRSDDEQGHWAAGLDMSSRADRGYVVAVLRGPLNTVTAHAAREWLLSLANDSAGRLIIDLSAVTLADISGLAVLVGTGRRASVLGGMLRLAAPAAAVSGLLSGAGLDRQLHIYHSVEAAISGIAWAR